ncbi:uncharacterized protein LOC126833693 isoform X2 [Adelges cooleyi]|nr:uncharacterized protein LOC126833693 isoform X2 [Adelges cooleyi]
MQNLSTSGSRVRADKPTMLRLAYGGYLCSLVARHTAQKHANKVLQNINNQEKIFQEEIMSIEKNVSILNDDLKTKQKLNAEKKNLNRKYEVLKLIDSAISNNSIDESIISLFNTAVHKIVLKNFEKLNESELGSVKMLLNEILNPLKLQDYSDKILVRQQIKELSIKIARLTKELDQHKLKCEELFEQQEIVYNKNLSLNLLKSQFGENPDPSLSQNYDIDTDKLFQDLNW